MEGEKIESIKVVLIGESGVGKTSLISRYVNNTFDEGELTTVGATYAGKTVEFPEYNKTIKLEIWDTAGQEKYRAVTKIFYKDASAVILVYDITRKESFNELKNYWYHQVLDNSPKETIIIIAANKSDLFENEQVPESEARDFAKSIKGFYVLTSALNSSGVDELFKIICKKYLDPNYDGEKVPARERRKTVTLKHTVSSEPPKKNGCC